ncbi:MAG: IS66 family insertion sequence element accessory protein TnpB [Lentisphaeria bacterium]
MISLPGDRSIFLYMEPTDMRRSFRGLCSLIYQHSGIPDDGSYYVFINRPKTHVKIMFWDGDGMAMFYKRLSKGTFILPSVENKKVCLDRRQLTLLLEGVVPLKTKVRFFRK